MAYSELLSDPEGRKEIFQELFGLEEELIPDRVVVSPIALEAVFPQDFRKVFDEKGLDYEEFIPEDKVLGKVARNILIEGKGLMLVLGRGVVEFVDSLRVLLSADSPDMLFVGSSAGIQGVDTGDIVAPEAVIPFENVSEIYVDVTRHLPVANPDLLNEVKVPGVKESLHATVPLFYMETLDFLRYLKVIGVNTIDMELSAFYRLASVHGARAAALLRVSDLPLVGEHYYSESYQRKKDKKLASKYRLLELALRFLGFS
ncbi:MAG: purine-nucleoside phosphorylase [Candidatus Diapherotrites archaeon]|nr:purine-nucleoside phosphorylase [Candidatus Diapherotrites archaeon]